MRKSRIDELRGIACLLVLAFHAIGSEPALRGDAFAYFANSLQFVRMPIFIAITGLLYGLSRGSQPLTWHGWLKRMRRLAPPFIVVTLVVCSLDAARGAGFHPIAAMIFGAWHLWYLLSLGVILLAVTVIEAAISLTSNRLWFAAGLAALAAAMGLFGGEQEFGLAPAVALMPFFLVGAAIGSTPRQEVPTLGKTLIYAAGFTSLVLHQLSLNGVGHAYARGSVVATCLGLAGFLLVGTICPQSRRLRQVGVHSLPIFLWHLPIYALASGLVLNRVPIDPHLAVLIRVALGVCVSMLLARTVETQAQGLSFLIGARSQKRRLLDELRELKATSDAERISAPPADNLTTHIPVTPSTNVALHSISSAHYGVDRADQDRCAPGEAMHRIQSDRSR